MATVLTGRYLRIEMLPFSLGETMQWRKSIFPDERQGYVPGKTLFYYRTRNDKEVDFVIRSGVRVTRLIQVCYSLEADRVRRREFDALVEAAEELRCDNLLVVTATAAEATVAYGGQTIRQLPVADFAAQGEAKTGGG